MSVIDAVDGHRLRHPRAIAKWLNFRRNAASILCAPCQRCRAAPPWRYGFMGAKHDVDSNVISVFPPQLLSRSRP
jgi:hypothetical protein